MRARLTGVSYIPWREQLELHQVEAMSDPEGFDDLFEALDEGGSAASGATGVRRVNTPVPNFQRHDATRKTAAQSNWDEEFSAAQAHARELLSRL